MKRLILVLLAGVVLFGGSAAMSIFLQKPADGDGKGDKDEKGSKAAALAKACPAAP
jgi:hypothetical protein